MRLGLSRRVRRLVAIGLCSLVAVTLSSCTGRGGGQLAPDGLVFAGAASFGFSFSCERSSNSTSTNPPSGRLRIQLSYTDHGTNLLGSGFSIHGTADVIDPVLESAVCIGQEPPPGGNLLIFLGGFQTTGSVPTGLPESCAAATPLCRFEVIVQDNDRSRAPSPGDTFSIRLSSGVDVVSELDAATVFYARSGPLRSGNLTVE
jgi:hypothetical protein